MRRYAKIEFEPGHVLGSVDKWCLGPDSNPARSIASRDFKFDELERIAFGIGEKVAAKLFQQVDSIFHIDIFPIDIVFQSDSWGGMTGPSSDLFECSPRSKASVIPDFRKIVRG